MGFYQKGIIISRLKCKFQKAENVDVKVEVKLRLILKLFLLYHVVMSSCGGGWVVVGGWFPAIT